MNKFKINYRYSESGNVDGIFIDTTAEKDDVAEHVEYSAEKYGDIFVIDKLPDELRNSGFTVNVLEFEELNFQQELI